MNNNSVTISRKAKRISLQRYLWSKLTYSPNKITFRDLGALLLNQLWLEQKCVSDAEFRKKFKATLEVSSNLLKELNLGNGFSTKAINRLASKVRTDLEGFLIPKRNFAQWQSKFDSLFVLTTSKPLGVNKKVLPPERYIGIGYRDKGTAKNPAVDASQSWQEIAQSNRSRLVNKIERLKYGLTTAESIPEKLEASRKFVEALNQLEEHDKTYRGSA